MIRNLIAALPSIRGRQRLLVTLDDWLGPKKLHARNGIMLEGYLSSAQDISYTKTKLDNPLLESVLDNLPESGIFIDCGANCGYFSSYAARRLGKDGLVLSLEPSAREFRRLLAAKKMNRHTCKWVALNVACGNSSSVVAVDSKCGHTGTNCVRTGLGDQGDQECVMMMRLDAIMDCLEIGDRRIDLLKIDVEGFEINVLEGLSKYLRERRIDNLVVEITDHFLRSNYGSKELLYRIMSSNGYCGTILSDAWQYDELFVMTPDN